MPASQDNIGGLCPLTPLPVGTSSATKARHMESEQVLGHALWHLSPPGGYGQGMGSIQLVRFTPGSTKCTHTAYA